MSSQLAGQAFFDRIPSKSNEEAEKCQALYDDWARTYDEDLTHESHSYTGPAEAAKAVAQHNTKKDAIILDAGCGTGLSGLALRSFVGADVTIDGIDISTGMLEVAGKKGVYRKLDTADLSKDIKIEDGTYDFVVCVGTLTGGHVGPVPALEEFTRVLKSAGMVVATIREDVWVSDGYEAEARRLESSGAVEVVSEDSVPYRQGNPAKLLVMRKA